MSSETPPPNGSDADTEAPSAEFAKALEEFERRPAPAAVDPSPEYRVGQKVSAKVVSIGEEHALLDYGGRGEAVADLKGFRDAEGKPRIAVGDTLELFVVQAGEPLTLGAVMPSKSGAALGRLREAKSSGVPVSGRVTGLNAGGLTVDLGGARGFCPVSQIELGFCDNPSAYVGKTLEFLVTAVEEGRRGAVLSRRQLLRRGEQEKAKELLAHLKPGDELEGTVARLENFGAFVNLGGLDGLVHVSEISHERIGHPSKALKPGDRVRVRVLRIEKGKDGKPRVALSIKAAAPDPWQDAAGRFAPGQRVSGTVARLADFGAFVNLAPGIDGLVHVSEAAMQRVGHVKEVLKPGQKVEAVVRSVEPDKRRISLSIRDALAEGLPPPRTPAPGEVVEGRVSGVRPFGVFVDLPEFGPRATGMIPREESGQPRNADLAAAFPLGKTVRVEILEPRAGKIRLRLEGVTPAVPAADSPRPHGEGVELPAGEAQRPRRESGERGRREGGAPRRGEEEVGRPRRGAAGGERPRGESSSRREGGERGRREGSRGGRPDREERQGFDRSRDHRRDSGEERGRSEGGRPMIISSRPVEGELTSMAIALRKAMEEARKKEREKG